MSDDKKSEKPLEDPEIYVNVTPKDGEDSEHTEAAERVEKKLAEKIEQALEENKSGGKEKQFEAAESEVKKAKESADPQQIEVIDVEVDGTNQEGDREGRAWSVIPKENKPAP